MIARRPLPLAIAASLALGLTACQPEPAADKPATSAPAAETAHAGDAHAQAATTADDAHAAHAEAMPLPAPPAQPWATDAPLREGMDGIASAVARAQAARQAGTFDAEQAKSLAGTVDERFKFMLANCKLEPEADVALHALLAQFVAGSRALAADPAAIAPMSHLQELLALYPRYFDHAGWQTRG